MSSASKDLLKQFPGKVSIKPVAAASGTYNRTISYTTKDKPDSFVGTGGGSPVVIATQYNAGASGFNLSHVETWARTETVASVTLTLEVRAGGTSVADAVKVGEGSLTINGSGSDESGSFQQIALNKPALIYPNENFYVIVTYPFGLNYPQGVITDSETISNRYLYYDQGAWGDLQTISGFETIGWLMFAGEQTAADVSWLKITSDQSGTVTAGNSSSIQLHFDGNIAQRGDQVAKVLMKTNDPVTPVVSIPVTLHLNDAPKFGNVPDPIVVAEGSTLTLKVNVKDPEGNTFTVNPSQTYANAASSFDGTILTITLTPTFGDAGAYQYVFSANDQYNATSQLTLEVQITHTNRAPVFVGSSKTISLNADGELNKFTLSNYFSDPDGDDITYTMASSADVLDVFASKNSFIIRPKLAGESDLAFALTDAYGATLNDTLKAVVNLVLAVEPKQTTGVSIYPNPVRETINIQLTSEWKGELLAEIIDATGRQMMISKSTITGSTLSLDAASLGRGFYLMRLNTKEKQAIVKLIKE